MISPTFFGNFLHVFGSHRAGGQRFVVLGGRDQFPTAGRAFGDFAGRVQDELDVIPDVTHLFFVRFDVLVAFGVHAFITFELGQREVIGQTAQRVRFGRLQRRRDLAPRFKGLAGGNSAPAPFVYTSPLQLDLPLAATSLFEAGSA